MRPYRENGYLQVLRNIRVTLKVFSRSAEICCWFTFKLENTCPLHDHNLPRSGSLKEMYISQYTHHFDSNEPRSHIAGWKVDIEPNNIPHRRSRMCVLNNPMISGSRKRPEHPKSAPPTLAYEFDVFTEHIEGDRLSCATLPNFHNGFPESKRSTDDLATRLQDLIVDASPPYYINDDGSLYVCM